MTDVIVVGGGLAGLACARECARQGAEVRLLEASDAVGGRVRSDSHEGFVLDRGFQVLLTAYPEARRVLDYDGLDLRPFFPGASVRCGGRFSRVADPFRRPLAAVAGAFSPVGSLADKTRVLRLRADALSGRLAEAPPRSTLETLRAYGFSDPMVDRFFRPFLGGVFLDSELRTSSHQLAFVWEMFARGDISLPAGGMESIPRQLATALPEGTVSLRARAARVGGGSVELEDGTRIDAGAVVVAGPTDGLEGAEDAPASDFRATTCLYFATEDSPLEEPILVLDGEGGGPVNNLCVPSDVAPGYAPEGQSLVSVTVLGDPAVGDADLEAQVRGQLAGWFGAVVEEWRHLRTYRIRQALPAWPPERSSSSQRTSAGVWLCGDYTENPSINGALLSGRRVAERICG